MKLKALYKEECEVVRQWRNDEMQFLRTPYMLTEDMQADFYDNVVNNRDSKHRYFAIIDSGMFIGMGGLTNIEWENGCAEISLILDPQVRGMGYGREAVVALLDMAFLQMRLESVYGEVYGCGNTGFWDTLLHEFGGYSTVLRNRKFCHGNFYSSMWFSFPKEPLRELAKKDIVL